MWTVTELNISILSMTSWTPPGNLLSPPPRRTSTRLEFIRSPLWLTPQTLRVIVILTMFQIIDEESSPGVGRGSGLRRASGQRKDNR